MSIYTTHLSSHCTWNVVPYAHHINISLSGLYRKSIKCYDDLNDKHAVNLSGQVDIIYIDWPLNIGVHINQRWYYKRWVYFFANWNELTVEWNKWFMQCNLILLWHANISMFRWKKCINTMKPERMWQWVIPSLTLLNKYIITYLTHLKLIASCYRS